jgi:hypothetical protein
VKELFSALPRREPGPAPAAHRSHPPTVDLSIDLIREIRRMTEIFPIREKSEDGLRFFS